MPLSAPLGDLTIPVDHGVRARIGPLTLWIRRESTEWRIAHQTSGDPFETHSDVSAPSTELRFPHGMEPARFACRAVDEPVLRLMPALADRHIVSRPSMQFSLLTRERVDIFVGTPLWLQVLDGNRLLCELPGFPLKSTWFGTDTRSGRLCYASQTTARMGLERALQRPGRIVTRMTMVNRTASSFSFDRINIPIPSLGLYVDAEGALWTEDVTVVHDGEQTATVQVQGQSPRSAVEAVRVASARESVPQSILVRAVNHFRDQV